MIDEDEFKEISFEEFEQYRTANKETGFVVVDRPAGTRICGRSCPGGQIDPLKHPGQSPV